MDKREALEESILKHDVDRILQLLKSGIDLNSPDRILMFAVDNGVKDDRIYELLFNYGALADYSIMKRAYAHATGYDERLLEKLLEHMKIYERYSHDYPGYSPLQNVAQYIRPDAKATCELMIKCGIDLHQPQGCMYTPLCLAVENKNISVIETLLRYGAEPLREYHSSICDPSVPLEHSFSLPKETVEDLVKYAALQVEHTDDENMQKFFTYFKKENSRPYLKYAQLCMAEIDILKMIQLDAKQTNLFDFVISQEEKLKSFFKDSEITNNVFKILRVTSLPIYKEVILKKFKRRDIPESLLEDYCRNKDENSKKPEYNDIPDKLIEGRCRESAAIPKKSDQDDIPDKLVEGRCRR